MQYIIYKYKGEYNLIDTLSEEFECLENGRRTQFRISGNKLYEFYSTEVVDDYFLDIGSITHWEKEKIYRGTVIYQSNSIEEIALQFAELKRSESKKS